MIIVLQSNRPREASNKESSKGDAWISFRRGNRIEFMAGLEAGGDGNRRDHVLGRDDWNWEAFGG